MAAIKIIIYLTRMPRLVGGEHHFDFVYDEVKESCGANGSVVDTHSLRRYLNKSYQELEKRLEVSEDSNKTNDDNDKNSGKKDNVSSRYVSTRDPDAAIVNRGKKSTIHLPDAPGG